MEQEARTASFKAELLQKQDMHLATLHKDLERQQNYLDKMRSEVGVQGGQLAGDSERAAWEQGRRSSALCSAAQASSREKASALQLVMAVAAHPTRCLPKLRLVRGARAQVRHEIDKLTASQRLDLNLEKG